jgi:hypothetical protein
MSSTHNFSSPAELAAAALGSVYAANEFGKAIQDHKHETDHYLKAAVGAAVAVGAFHQLQKKVHHDGHEGTMNKHNEHGSGQHTKDGKYSGDNDDERDPPHHKRRLLEEAAGAYAVGRDLLGDRNHHVTHLLAEALGATGLIKDLKAREEMGEYHGSHKH